MPALATLAESFPGEKQYFEYPAPKPAERLCKAPPIMSHIPNPEHVRMPQHLNAESLRLALDELDGKIKTLRNRAHATTATSQHTYHEHIASLEAKRAKLAEKLGPRPAPGAEDAPHSAWEEIMRGIDNLRDDLRNII
jgi:hypothetical protein